jgi:hypothetical protein
MKVIQYTTVSLPQKEHFTQKSQYYGVSLGNGFSCQFTSKRDADKFAVSTKSFLTDCLIELNELYIDVWTDYRRNWFYFTGRTTESHKAMHKVESEIINSLQAVENCFGKIERTTDNFTPWRLISKAISSVLDIIDHLFLVRKKRNEYVERKNLEILRKRAHSLIYSMSDYGSTQRNEYSIVNQLFFVREKLPRIRTYPQL